MRNDELFKSYVDEMSRIIRLCNIHSEECARALRGIAECGTSDGEERFALAYKKLVLEARPELLKKMSETLDGLRRAVFSAKVEMGAASTDGIIDAAKKSEGSKPRVHKFN